MEKNTPLKEIRKEVEKAVRYLDDASVAVKIYDCDESGEQTYDIEITVYDDGNYNDSWVSDIGYENELSEVEKRAKVVLRTVKKWFEYDNDITVESKTEIYSM